ncbi:meiotic recombination protein REC114 isoform X3 [Etheostoma spectabile]|uniref:meiotic recombination protein REC114 isoform X3 n=1 Tax=Etheostoma spectabile TaxID=54343 RepID=UPI0013AF1E1C|nr:meiotic recombination protein REC114 isoform X3 [Etheostoma spectabile]
MGKTGVCLRRAQTLDATSLLTLASLFAPQALVSHKHIKKELANLLEMATSQAWRLKRYGRFVPGSTVEKTWKIFEASSDKPEIVLTIMESGFVLVMQGQESLDTIPLLNGSDLLKVHQKSDNLMFRFSVKGESRMMRMQFDGRSREEAIKECSTAVEKLMKYMPVTNQEDAPLPPNQSPAEVSAAVIQQTWRGKAVGVGPEVVQGSLSIKHLSQHMLGETALTLPQAYRHLSLAQGDLEPILRICLLDPSFPAYVEKVEGELKKLLQE